MSNCDECGKRESMPYQCRHCGGSFCAEHRLPEAHDCPGLAEWGDPGDGVFDSGFDDSVSTEDDGGLLGGRVDTGVGGPLGYVRGNMTFVFLGAMWVTFAVQLVFQVATGLYPLSGQAIAANPEAYRLYSAIFTLSPAHPEYVWTWVTSIFSHGGFAHIAINSIVVYFFGRLVEDYIGSKAFVGLFLASGVVAGLGQIAVQVIELGGIPEATVLIRDGVVTDVVPGVLGASGAALAVMAVLTVFNPGLRVYLYFLIPVPLWLLTTGYTALTVFSIVGGGIGAGGVAQAAHLLGLIVGLAYGYRVRDRVRVPRQLQFGGPGGPGGGPGGPGGPGGRGRGPF
jgi:membrane associated rhomboid family serine protease